MSTMQSRYWSYLTQSLLAAAFIFALASYSYARPGHADARAVLAATVDDRLFFAGEACSVYDYPTTHGAYRTGEAAAGRPG